jgi:hypothetical protein
MYPTDRRKRACEDWECRQQKEELLIFEWLYFWCQLICGMEGGTIDWNSQRNKGTTEKTALQCPVSKKSPPLIVFIHGTFTTVYTFWSLSNFSDGKTVF